MVGRVLALLLVMCLAVCVVSKKPKTAGGYYGEPAKKAKKVKPTITPLSVTDFLAQFDTTCTNKKLLKETLKHHTSVSGSTCSKVCLKLYSGYVKKLCKTSTAKTCTVKQLSKVRAAWAAACGGEGCAGSPARQYEGNDGLNNRNLARALCEKRCADTTVCATLG